MVSQAEGMSASKEPSYLTLQIRKRPWYVWVLRAIWWLWMLFWLEFAIGSKQELEPQAFSIAVRVLIVSLLLGLGLYFWKLREGGKGKKGEEGRVLQ